MDALVRDRDRRAGDAVRAGPGYAALAGHPGDRHPGGGNGPRGQRAAARHGDIYSCYIEERADVAEVAPRLASLEAICTEIGRDPATLGRSVGIYVDPTVSAGAKPNQLSGSAEEIADGIRTFREAGFTRLELMFNPGTMAALEALGPVLALVRAD